ncbi:MAG: sulfite exporter TauE/SafE family protein [Deltaproteobacteria bacterium]|nr:sulfite exporter TauE/SafE family protein [Deltaproteobacteria bacterium]
MDKFEVWLPIAGMPFNVLLLLLIGVTVGICGGFFGIGGAWIVTPALNIFGFPMPYAIGTDLAHMGGKSIVSTIRHGKFGNVDIRLGVSMIVGTTVGMELGANLVMALERAGLAESVIRKAYVVFLFLIGSYVLYDYISHQRRQKAVDKGTAVSAGETLAHRLQRFRIPPMIHFKESGVTCSLWLPVGVGLVTGVVASVLGVGGGFIRMPALIYLVGCPTLVAVGTDLFEVMITGAYGAFTYGMKGRVDLVAAMWMLMGAAAGAQLGTVAVKYVRGYSIRLLFATTIFIACASVLLKQLEMQLASSITILAAGIVISGVILVLLVRGMWRERAARKRANQARILGEGAP